MTRLLLVAHEPLASAMQQVARHAYPDAADEVCAIDVRPDDTPDSVERRMQAALADEQRDVLILCDVANATPANAACRFAQRKNVRVIAGLSVPMLWRALCYLDRPLDEWARLALEGGSRGVTDVPLPAP